MSDIDFTLLLKESESNRPDHVPAEYVRVDHWGAAFNAPLFINYSRTAETKKY
jgi:hypothetical protein